MKDDSPRGNRKKSRASPLTEPDLIVGLGSSSGGMEALNAFFAAVPGTTGLAYVVIQHLDANGANLLPGALAKAIRLPVVEVVTESRVAADHVYIAPPHAMLQLDGNVLRVVAIAKPDEPRGPIDAFFTSLAQARQAAAVGIVLSGTGTDGTLGLRAISDAGGLTLAQDPATARHDSMPRTAAMFGPADRVMPPERIPDELMAYAQHVRALAADGEGDALHQQITAALGPICDVLMERTEHNFKHYKTSTLVRRVGRRMQIHRIRTAEKYIQYLRNDSDEVVALFRELLIGVTAFFRDPEVFEALARDVVPELLDNRGPKDPVRVWVPGCATGEEAYSIGMLLRERLDRMPHPPEIQIFATDINERALTVARHGAYSPSIAEHVSPERLKRFFLRKGNQYHVVKELREICLFSAHDLIRDPPFSRLDLISCRNLLIYLGPHLQKKLIPLFHYALRPGGYLLLGPSETINAHRDLFRPVNVKHRISQRLPTAVSSRPSSVADVPRIGPRLLTGAAPGQPDLHDVMQRIVLDEFAPRSLVVNEDGQILCASGGLEKYLGITAGTFQNNVIKLAKSGVRVGLRSAFSEAVKSHRTIVHENLTLKTDQGNQRVRLTVQPMPQLGEQSGLYLIVFQDAGPTVTGSETKVPSRSRVDEADAQISQLERELQSTREELEKTIQDLESTNEELKSSNEELLSMNEELQSANEELETSKEEIQAANEAFARTNSDLENLFGSTQIATVFLDEDRRIQRFTPAITEVYNLLPTDIGRPLSDLTSNIQNMPPLPDTTLLQRLDKPHEVEVVTNNGRIFVRRVLPYRTHRGAQRGMVVTFVDVTVLKAAERAVRESERLYRGIGESIPYGVWVCDASGRNVYASESFLKLTGLTPEQCSGIGWKSVLHPDDADRTIAAWQACVKSEGHWEIEHRFRGVDGRWHPVLARGVPVRDEEGRVVCWAGINLDISKLKEAEGRIRDQAELLKLAPVMVRDLEGRIVFWDRGAEQLYGFTAAEALGKISHELLKTGFPKPYPELRDELLRHGEWEGELMHRRKDGSEITVICRWVLRPAEGDREAAVLVVAADITDRRRMEAALRAADRQKDAFLAMLAHELRNPLAPVLNAVQLLRVAGPKDPLLDQQRSVIERQVSHMKRLLDDLLDVARITNGTIRVRKSLLDLRDALLTAIEAAKPLISSKDQELHVTIPERPLPVRGDSTRLTQIFSNLLNNAAKYTEPGGDVWLNAEVHTDAESSEVIVRIRDNGQGMTLEMLQNAFNLFVQGDQSLDREQGGLGIGLTLARRLIVLHGGTITAASEGLDQGCEFTVRLPLMRNELIEPRGESSAGDRTATSARRAPRRILVVDHNKDGVDSLAMLLGVWNYEVKTAHDGPTALQIARTFQPDVAFLDIGLPRMSGHVLARELRNIPELEHTVLVALTGFGRDDDRRKAREAGFHHFLMKPVEPTAIQAFLAELPG